MQKPDSYIEIFLQPGEIYFGDNTTRIRTILGSCVSMTFWHPTKLIGGMTHIMLPERGKRNRNDVQCLDGKYADEAVRLMLNEMACAGTHACEYQVKLFGGGDMFSKNNALDKHHIGVKNTLAATALLNQHGFSLHAKHFGGSGHRSIIFDIWSGYVWVRHSLAS
jgi:chemotaxis protein CheD